MFRKKIAFTFVSIFLIIFSACNMPGPTVPSPAVISGSNPDPAAATAAIQTQVAEIVASTAGVQTQVAFIVASTAAAETAFANAVAETLAAMPSKTPEFTFTPSLTPTPTFTLTPETARVSVSVETNCRSGPGTAYDIRGVLQVGQVADVVGRSASSDNWIIKLPSKPAITCWVWGQYATVTGDTSGLTVFTPPPTPTLAAGFDVSYIGMVTCGAEFGFTLQISNHGSVTWESVKVDVTDTATATAKTHTRDSFKRFTGCAPSGEDLNLESGETGFATTVAPGQFAYNPTGHAMTAVVTVCSQNALAGTCLNKTISFTP